MSGPPVTLRNRRTADRKIRLFLLALGRGRLTRSGPDCAPKQTGARSGELLTPEQKKGGASMVPNPPCTPTPVLRNHTRPADTAGGAR